MPVFSSVITANGVTSEPVPLEVGTAIKYAFSPILGKVYILFLMSENLIAISIKSTSGCSYITHIILAASIALPPPIAIMQSGLKLSIAWTPSFAEARVGSGCTFENVVYDILISSNLLVIGFV